MRCQTVRSFSRALLTAGLLASTQTALLHASWKDRMQPSVGTCFLHDLHWDHCRFSAPDAILVRPVAASEFDAAVDLELELCLAAAKRFEIQSQAEAILVDWKYLREKVSFGASRLFHQVSQAKPIIIASLEQTALTLVQSIKIPDALPVTAIVTQEVCGFDDEWNCGTKTNTLAAEPAIRFPKRDGGNLFVYAINFDPDLTDSDACSDSFCDPKQNNFVAHSWQVGVDPVCPEIFGRDSVPTWIESVTLPSVCCPLGMDCDTMIGEAISTMIETAEVLTATRPPILETAYDDSESLLPDDWTAMESIVGFESIAQSSADQPVTSPYITEEIYEPSNQTYAASTNRWLGSLGVADWALHIGKKFVLRNFEPTLSEAISPLGPFSIEDLIVPPKTRAFLFDSFRDVLFATTKESTTLQSKSNATVDELDPRNVVENNFDHSFETADASILRSSEFEAPRGNSVSKYMARSIRSLAMYLLDFASRIDDPINNPNDKIEVASGTTQPAR